MKKQVIIIHGGDPYDSYEEFLRDLKSSKVDIYDLKGSYGGNWKDSLNERLGTSYEVFQPEMPNSMNARYVEWEIYFCKLLRLVQPGAIFIGHSLGAVFLARYFAENPDHDAAALILLAPPFKTEGGFAMPADASRLEKISSKILLYFSQDDPIVSFSNLKKYQRALPHAPVRTFADRGHFYAQKEFPEIVEDIKSI